MNWKAAFVTGLILLFTVTLYAQPPDGFRPSHKDICNPLKEGTSGLYGLCVAYCKAQYDDELGSLEQSNSQKQILKAYNKKKTYEDPYMPCFKGCPCYSVEDVDFIASHQNFYSCEDYFTEEVNGTWYESFQSMQQAGEFDANGDAQVSGSVYAIESEPDIQALACNWEFKGLSPPLKVERTWDGNSFDEEDRSKFEHCQSIIAQVVDELEIPCETNPECGRRVLIDHPTTHDGPFLEVNGALINDPPEDCVNTAVIAKVEWYWGDGEMDTFLKMADGYVYPFPNSHTYIKTGWFVWKLYAFDEEGKIVGKAGGFFANL